MLTRSYLRVARSPLCLITPVMRSSHLTRLYSTKNTLAETTDKTPTTESETPSTPSSTNFTKSPNPQASAIPAPHHITEINANQDLQQQVQIRQEQIRSHRKQVVDRIASIAALDTSQYEMAEQYSSPEEAYQDMLAELRTCFAEDRLEDAYEVITSMRHYGLSIPKDVYDESSQIFARAKQIYKVRDMWEFMTRDRIPPTEDSFMGVIRVYSSIHQYEWALKSFMKMCETLSPSEKAFEETMDLFSVDSHIGNLRKAEHIFYAINRFDIKHTPQSCANFIRLLLASGYEGDGDRATDVLKFMKTKVIHPHALYEVRLLSRGRFSLYAPL
eukprot:TRINITY_DN6603_c1_g1_i4.p1 TRINITY_DN6603_c1_g1~~TRINITY_DN6603_c1_g1_i4.p1  ORF type:complete len:330 (+),score=73.36 TRINITY_DN6603_c1_g1_i4:76-1065(+)